MRIYLDSIDCRLHQSEIGLMAGEFLQAGHTPVDNPTACDLAVVNTCAVTAAAAADLLARVRQLHRQRPQAGIVVTGCWSTLAPTEAQALPGVGWVVPNDEKGSIPTQAVGARIIPAPLACAPASRATGHGRGLSSRPRMRQPLRVLFHGDGTRPGAQPPGGRCGR